MSLTHALALAGIAVAALVVVPHAGAAEPPANLPASVDLRPSFQKWGLETRKQGGRGTCSVFAITGGLEYAAAASTGKGTQLSVEFLNWAAHHAVNRRTDGGFFSDMWKGFLAYGVCPEEALPYRAQFDADLQPEPAVVDRAKQAQALPLQFHWIKEWNPRTGLTPEHVAGIKRTLASNWPVCGGLRWPKREHWDNGVLTMCGPEAVFDGHSVLLVGYRDDPAQPGGGVFLIRNSGGPSRDGALPYAYATAYMNDAAWIGTQPK